VITYASFGDEITAGGLGAILTQIDKEGRFYIIAYASRKLQKYEQN
jgi:RNase H-like domain found in reverse transcriptase